MNYDLLAAFDHQGVDPIAQAQAASLLSQQSQIRPPTFEGGAGIAQGRQEYISPQAPYVNPVNYAEQGGYRSNNQIAQDAFAAAQELQQQGRTTGFEVSGVGGNQPEVQEPQAQAIYRRFGNSGVADYARGVGAAIRTPFGFANPSGSPYAPVNMAGNVIPESVFQSRWQQWADEQMARENYRRMSRMVPFLAQYTGFNPTQQLDPSQVGDARRWRR